MKQTFFLAILSIFSSVAFAQSVDDCKKFGNDVLKKAIIKSGKPGEDLGEFVRDETKALGYITQYDVKKLILPGVRAILRESRKEFLANNCSDKSTKPLPFCESYGFSNFIFFQGLINAMANYGWKPATILLGKQKIWDYMQVVSKEGGVSSISLMTSTQTLIDLYEAKLITGINLKAAQDLLASMDKESDPYAKAINAEKDFKKKCDIDKKYPHMEDDFVVKYGPKFKVLLAPWKKP